MKHKTNAMRILDSMNIPYGEYDYTNTDAISGIEVATVTGQNPAKVFKTLVTTGKTGTHYVFMIPVEAELDLKKAAAYIGEKSIEMLKANDLLTVTGYVHGGCSPIGMKKPFRTTLHNTAKEFDSIIFSGGKIGYQIELSFDILEKIIYCGVGDIAK